MKITMTNQDLDNLYKANLSESHSAALRGVFDAGYQAGLGQAPTPGVDASAVVADSVAVADEPVVTQP